ncbi:MAG: insulinase family protein, partial [Syntrophobacteraceae bacterium]|nr:insulinase family protein [Syntrophobacteraceae bacterium]
MFQKTVLKNGMRIVTEKIPYVHSVSTGIWVNVGSRDEQENERGITHLIEHMLFKGTERRSALDIAKELDSVGGFANAFTSKEHVCFHAKVLDTHLPLVVDVLTDIFLNSSFDPQEIGREQQVILQEIRMIEDTPDEFVHILFQESFWRSNPLGLPIYGSVETVEKADRDGIRTYLSRMFHPSRIVIAAAGNLEHERFVDLLAQIADQAVQRREGRNLHLVLDQGLDRGTDQVGGVA